MYRIHKEEWTSKASDWPQGYFKQKCCKHCSKNYSPNSPCNLYCSEGCAVKGKASKYLERTYGITYKNYETMLEEQGHLCAICNGVGFKMAEHHNLLLVVDHDHVTGNVRGLLCHNCNRGLGLFKDSQESLEKAKDYLKGATTIPKGSTLK